MQQIRSPRKLANWQSGCSSNSPKYFLYHPTPGKPTAVPDVQMACKWADDRRSERVKMRGGGFT